MRRHLRRARRQQRRPPPVPEGWRTGPPDFVGVGAQKAGTSWWFSLLCEHPRVQPPPGMPKELRFFDPYWREPFGPDEVAAYARLFARPEGARAGEWTPRYLSDFWVAPLLAAAAPEARLLVLLRDPVERYRSGVAHDQVLGRAPHPAVAADAFARGLYHQQLTWLLQHAERRNLLILQYERCVEEPEAQLRRTFAFLGLDDEFVPADLDRRVNDARAPKPALEPHVRDALAARYTPDVLRLVDDFPEVDPHLWSTGAGA